MKRLLTFLAALCLAVSAFGAANITLSSITVDSTGKTITATLGGGSGSGFGITNANGIIITARSLTRPVTAQSVSGTTLTLNIGFPIGTGDTVTLSTNSGATSTIFDSSANTVQTYNNTAVTNNSTVTVTGYNADNAAFVHFGGHTVTVSGGRNFWFAAPSNSGFAVGVTGTEVALLFQGGSFSAEIDGGGFSTVTTLTSNFAVAPISSSLGGTFHTIAIKQTSGSTVFDTGTGSTTQGCILVAGASNSVSTPTNYGTSYFFDSAPFTTYGYMLAEPLFTTSFGGHTYYQFQPGVMMRFKTDASIIAFFELEVTARTYVVYQDGVALSPTYSPPVVSGLYNRHVIASGLSGTHEYEVFITSPFITSASSAGWYNGSVELNNSGLMSTTHSGRVINAQLGDSITALSNGTPAFTDVRDSDFFIAAHQYNQDITVQGQGGQKVSTWGRDNAALIIPSATRVHIRLGINDVSGGTAQATFTADYGTMVDNIRARIGPGKTIYCYEPFPSTSIAQASIDAYGGYIQTALVGKSNVVYIPTSGWIPRNTTYLPDGVHPNALGYSVLANRHKPIYAPTAITLTGPASGFYGASLPVTLTVAIATGATFTGDQTVTLSDGGAGGTFTPSVGSPGTSSVTVTPADGATSFTCTYAPTNGSTKTITPTSGQAGWTMPDPYVLNGTLISERRTNTGLIGSARR